MKNKKETIIINTSALIEKFNHIIYDKKVNKNFDYKIIRSCTNDGTIFFLNENINRVFENLINKISCKKVDENNYREIKEYHIGDLTLENNYKQKVKLPCGIFPGFVQRLCLPVKVFYWN